ncbi:MAG: GntR family transcriptional regulator [Rhodobacteraceae bacterium]|jgi:GntR family transcriptional regulator|nr:GntR family transcriptional regulator [Paracoccaceae bacterium]
MAQAGSHSAPPRADAHGRGPLYLSLAATLRRDIANGRLRPGEKLPAITAMADSHSVSVITVRQAIGVLEGEGLLQRFQGRGTFVRTTPGIGAQLTLRSDWDSLLGHLEGKALTLQQIEECAARPAIEPAIGRLEDEYLFMKRVHSSGETPYALVEVYISRRLFDLDPEGFRRSMVISVLSRLSVAHVARMRQTVSFTTADAETARLLRLPPQAAIGDVMRVIADREDRAIYVGLTKYRGDFVNLEFDLGAPPG